MKTQFKSKIESFGKYKINCLGFKLTLTLTEGEADKLLKFLNNIEKNSSGWKKCFDDKCEENRKIWNERAEALQQIKKYKQAYQILMEYWDSISDEQKPIVDKQLKKLGL